MKTIGLILLGIMMLKVSIEVINYRHAKNYMNCVAYEINIKSDVPPAARCRHKLNENILEQIITYQPNFFCKIMMCGYE